MLSRPDRTLQFSNIKHRKNIQAQFERNDNWLNPKLQPRSEGTDNWLNPELQPQSEGSDTRLNPKLQPQSTGNDNLLNTKLRPQLKLVFKGCIPPMAMSGLASRAVHCTSIESGALTATMHVKIHVKTETAKIHVTNAVDVQWTCSGRTVDVQWTYSGRWPAW